MGRRFYQNNPQQTIARRMPLRPLPVGAHHQNESASSAHIQRSADDKIPTPRRRPHRQLRPSPTLERRPRHRNLPVHSFKKDGGGFVNNRSNLLPTNHARYGGIFFIEIIT